MLDKFKGLGPLSEEFLCHFFGIQTFTSCNLNFIVRADNLIHSKY